MTDSCLQGMRVIDCSTLFAGPMAAMVLGDLGADVIKIEHPSKPDPSRTHGPAKDGVGLWWKMLGRNKRTVTLDLSKPDGARIFSELASNADVVIENFRPGTLERWNIGPESLLARNDKLIIARVTGFGQVGPWANRAGFGTLAESMSGFAAITGEPDGPPTLPPFGLADGIAALTCLTGVLGAVVSRQQTGRGQVVDVAIIEPLVSILGPQAMAWDQLRQLQPRTGNRSANNSPRNTYLTSDGRWVAVSASAQSVADRVLTLVGHPEVIDEPWFRSGSGRAAHADLLDGYVGSWIARHTTAEVIEAFGEAQAAVAPIYTIADVFDDPQYNALGTITSVPDPDLGQLRMPNVMFRMSETPGSIRHTGRRHGEDTAAVLKELGIDSDELDRLREAGVV